MKKILYYITDHGRGHATRTVAITRELKKSNIDVIIRNSNQFDFLINSLPNSSIISGITDVGPTIKSDGMTINETDSKSKIKKWIDELEIHSTNEQNLISKINPNLIISDISVMPILAARKSKIPSLAISNFSWYDTLTFLEKNYLEILSNTYDYADSLIQLPLGTPMNHFKRKFQANIVSRIPTKSKNKLKTELGIKNKFLILFVLGPNFELKSTFENDIGVIVTNSKKTNSNNVISVNDWTEGQDLVAASDLVICKCGYGIISECLTNGIPFHYVIDSNHIEQLHIHKYLKTQKFGCKINISELDDFHFTKDYMTSLIPLNKQKIGTINVVEHITKFL